MSDCFDHEADAWDSLNDGYDEPSNMSRWRTKSTKTSYKTCNKCGVDNLHWAKISPSVWRLRNADLSLHVCNHTPSVPEPVKPMREFEPVGYINEMGDAIIIANLPVQYRRKHMSLMARADTYGYTILYVKS